MIMDTIHLDKENNTIVKELTGNQSYHIHMTQQWEYFLCLLLQNGKTEVVVSSDVPDVSMTIVCISYATQDKPATLYVDGQTNHDRVHIDMTLLSLAGQWAVLDVQWGISMPVGVVKTEWYLLQENILLHPSARVRAVPKLDIHSNDVKASHGARVHAIDDTELFYMQAKWLSSQESKKLYIQWYVQNMFDKIPNIDQSFVEKQHHRIATDLSL